MIATLKAIHLLALLLGAGASLGNIYLMLAAQLLLTVIRYGWHSGAAFNAKLAGATLLLLFIGFLNLMAPGWARRGGPPGWTGSLHVANFVLLCLTVVLAAFAFA